VVCNDCQHVPSCCATNSILCMNCRGDNIAMLFPTGLCWLYLWLSGTLSVWAGTSQGILRAMSRLWHKSLQGSRQHDRLCQVPDLPLSRMWACQAMSVVSEGLLWRRLLLWRQ
jgi:hypothetical protein